MDKRWDVKDGLHRKPTRHVIVTPLEPPFEQDVAFFTFAGEDKRLAVSHADGELIRGLLNGQPEGRIVTLSRVDGDDDRIKVGVRYS